MPILPSELEEIYNRALDELFALGPKLPRGSFRSVAEKYDIKEYTLRMKYWKRTEEKPSLFLRSKGITIGNIKVIELISVLRCGELGEVQRRIHREAITTITGCRLSGGRY